MQIHELTKKQTLDEGIGTGIASALGTGVAAAKGVGQAVGNYTGGVKTAYQQAQMGQKYSAMADKAQKAWTTFATQLEKSIVDPAEKAAFVNRTDGRYQQTLQAWVEKNLLSGQYLPNFTNKDQLLAIIAKLSEPKVAVQQPTAAQQPTAQTAPTTQAPGTAKPTMAQPGFNASNVGNLKTTPGATVPPAAKPAAPVTPAKTITAPNFKQAPAGYSNLKTNVPGYGQVPKIQPTVAKPAGVKESQQLAETLNAATEKQLFTQLIQTAATGLTATSGATATAQAGQQAAGQQAAGQQAVAQTPQAAQQILISQAQMSPQTLTAIEAITSKLSKVGSSDPQTLFFLKALGFNTV
jgi:hypothetical protein